MMDIPVGDGRAPDPGLEAAIAAGQRGELDTASVMRLFAHWPLYVPSGADFLGAPEKFQPVIFQTPNGPMMAIYTAPDRMAPIADLAPYWTRMSGLAILGGGSPGTGYVVNPGSKLGLEVRPDAVAGMRADLADDAPPTSMPAGRQLTAFEQSVLDLRLRRVTEEQVIAALAAGEIFVPSATMISSDLSELAPATFERQGITYLAAFGSDDLVGPPVTDRAEYVLRMPEAEAFLRSVGDGYGVIVNPGTVFEYLVEPEVVGTF